MNRFKNLGLGLGLRAEHYPHILSKSPKLDWFEALSENYMGIGDSSGGRALKTLEKVRESYDIALHGVSLSIGSSDPLNENYLKKLKELAGIIEPSIISDHLCWTGVEGINVHDLLPLPYTSETIDHVVQRISKVQDFLKSSILIENVSSYLSYHHSEMTEWDFLNAICKESGCGLLLDINNIYVSSKNHGYNAVTFLENIDAKAVGQIHLAGHSSQGDLLVDTHDGPVCSEVWHLYQKSIGLVGEVSTMVEWDANIPPFEILESEILKAGVIITEERSHGSCAKLA
jgi:uncharacterized protein (UPF0276 family)